MTNPYEEAVAADRRLLILTLLALSGGYKANQYILHDALPQYGHYVSKDVLSSDLAWLEEQGLVTLEEIASVMMATISERGLDVQGGRARVPGVKRPRPEG